MPKGTPNPQHLYGIYSRPWGFEVSIVRNGKLHRAQFGIAGYGGIAQALAHAQMWRDEIVKSLPPTTRRVRAEKVRTNNTTGTPGVFCLLSENGKAVSWLAKTYLAPGEILRAAFSVAAEGDAAQALAIRERRQQLGQMSGLAKVHPAEERIRNESPRPPTLLSPKRQKSEIVRTDNSSGIPGVSFKGLRAGHPGYWVATTYTAGKGSVSKAFSVAEHGYEEAKILASIERERQLENKRSGIADSLVSGRRTPWAVGVSDDAPK